MTRALVLSADWAAVVVATLTPGTFGSVTGVEGRFVCVGVARARIVGVTLCPGVDIDRGGICGGAGDRIAVLVLGVPGVPGVPGAGPASSVVALRTAGDEVAGE